MTAHAPRQVVFCNGANKSTVRQKAGDTEALLLDYRDGGRVRLGLPDFVRNIGSVPNRILDLLEICAYVFAADRLTHRGKTDSLIYDSWSRTFHFGVKVRDEGFWNSAETKAKLGALLQFISGDREYLFHFVGGHSTPPTHLFEDVTFLTEPDKPHHVMLFSGGLDSLAGAVERLSTSSDIVCLICHQSGQPSTTTTQNRLIDALSAKYPDRVRPYRFKTGLTNGRAISETQRTRTFVYGSIAFALASALAQNEVTFYENGITSLNFPRRQDLLNSRASRTTHPKTIWLLGDFLSHIAGKPIAVANAYRWKTKADVLDVIKKYGAQDLVPSAVSCSKTSMSRDDHNHCGGCFQCIDRRFSASAVGLSAVDHPGLYSTDFLGDKILDPQTRTALIDYVRLGLQFKSYTIDSFYSEWLAEIAEALSPSEDEQPFVESLFDLIHRFGKQTTEALKNFDDVTKIPVEGSLLQIIQQRDYLKGDAEGLSTKLSSRLSQAIPTMFSKNRPKDENDFNDKLNGLLRNDQEDYRREFPVTSFGLARVIPDHELTACDLLIESKYVRQNTPVSKITDQIAADIVKYPASAYILFVIYDPDRAVRDDAVFIRDIEAKRQTCMVTVIR